MDPITHGIAGALIGKAFFTGRRFRSERSAPAESHARVAIFAAVLGAVFPDVDIFVDAASSDPLAIAIYHRGFTHSFVGLPIFAAALAWPTRLFFNWYASRLGKQQERANWRPPSFWALFAIYAAAIASHIILDGFTSFGTRMLNPFSMDRVAWDTLFIIDFVFAALLLLPQIAAWIHHRASGALGRALKSWLVFTTLAAGVWALARAAGFPFSPWAIAICSAVFAAVFFVPARKSWGGWISRSTWCRAGFAICCAYVAACGFEHHEALAKVRAFVAQKQIPAEKIGALPLPMSLLDWNGLILTRGGVWQSDFSLADSAAPVFNFAADSAPNRYTEEAAKLEPVRTFLWFARFPVMRFVERNGRIEIDYADVRFYGRDTRGLIPFTFSVVLNPGGKLIWYGWERRSPTAEGVNSSGSAKGQ